MNLANENLISRPSVQLFEAASHGRVDEVEDLIKNGIDLNVRNDLDETPLYVASKNGTYIFCISNHSVPFHLFATKTRSC